MARIPMTSGFVVIPEGEYVFRIYDATYDLSLIHISEPTRH